MFTRVLPLSNITRPASSAKRVQSRPVPTFLPATNFVPRCLTRILPAVTSSPPYRFTPKRLLTLSRPLRTLPCPFLCAICFVYRSSGVPGEWPVIILNLYFFDLQHRQFLSVANGLVIALAALHLERHFLLSTFVLHYIGKDARVGHSGGPYVQLAVVIYKQHPIQCHCLARFHSQALHFQRIARSDA